ncbi:MAG: DNA polymerase III subunit delta [Endomicrobium sp.]|jgi:DNA polymerase-3 subunit delta|nr:DNA polymerase III subunit delta [Endomicrobium sp.]
MPILKIQDFNKLIQSKKTSPVYLLAGEESYLIDMCLNKIEKILAVDDLNREVFYACDSNSVDILNAIQTLPFLSDRRLVIVKDLNKMKSVDAECITGYLSNIVSTSCLVLVYLDNYKKETISKRKELINTCFSSKNCVTVDCRKQYENEAKEFIKTELQSRGKFASYNLISTIVEENGTDLLNISNEIEKLSLYVGKNKKEIKEEDLEKVGGYTKEVNIYALSSELESKNLKRAVFILEKLLNEGEEPVVILSAISSSVRKMLNAKSMLEEQKMSIPEVALTLRIHSFYANAFFSNLKKHNTKTLKESLKIVLQADMSIKTGGNDGMSALEKAVLFICK